MHTGWRHPFNCVPELRKFIIYISPIYRKKAAKAWNWYQRQLWRNGTDYRLEHSVQKNRTSFYIPLLPEIFHCDSCSVHFQTEFSANVFFNEKQPLTLVSSSMFLFSSSTVWSWPFFAFVRLPNLDSLSSSLDPRSATSLSRRELTTDKSPTCFFKSSTYESNN